MRAYVAVCVCVCSCKRISVLLGYEWTPTFIYLFIYLQDDVSSDGEQAAMCPHLMHI